ncbi:MAG: hypothetical protein ACPL7L_04305, partial [bacterium]
ACEFVLDGISGLNPPPSFKDVHADLLQLVKIEKAILDYAWQNYSYGVIGSVVYAPEEITELDSLAQTYVDSFDLAQSKTLFVPFSQLPGWAQAKKYYLEASLTSYMLSEIAQDFEDLLPLPQISTPVKGTVQDEDTNNNVYQLLSGELTLYDFSLQKFVEFQIATTVTASGVTNQSLSLDVPKSLELVSYSHASLTESDDFYILQTQTSTTISCTVRAHSDLFGQDVTIYSNYGQYTSVSISLSVPQPDPQNALAQKTLDELVRLVRYAENLQFNLSTMSVPQELTVSATMLVQAGKELSGVLYWIPVRWAQLSALPEYYLFSYPEYSSASTQPAP